MLCKQITKEDYPTVSINDRVEVAIGVLQENDLKAIPVITQEGQYKGILTNKMLQNHPTGLIETILTGIIPQTVSLNDHIFRALRLMNHQHLPIIGVVSSTGEYVGIITTDILLPSVALLLGMNDAPGGSVTIAMDRHNYSFGELARLIETNDADILQLNTYTESDTGLLIINLKISREDISDVVATLQRYDYIIRYYFGQETYENEIKSNYDALINYLNI